MKRGGVDQNLIQGAKILAKTQGTGGVTLGGAITGGITGAIDEVFNDPAKRAKFKENVQAFKDERAAKKEKKTPSNTPENNQGAQTEGNTGDAGVDIMNAVTLEEPKTSEELGLDETPETTAKMLGATPIKMLFQANKNRYK